MPENKRMKVVPGVPFILHPRDSVFTRRWFFGKKEYTVSNVSLHPDPRDVNIFMAQEILRRGREKTPQGGKQKFLNASQVQFYEEGTNVLQQTPLHGEQSQAEFIKRRFFQRRGR